jgi:hypothetical protein
MRGAMAPASPLLAPSLLATDPFGKTFRNSSPFALSHLSWWQSCSGGLGYPVPLRPDLGRGPGFGIIAEPPPRGVPDGVDSHSWRLAASGVFLVRSAYRSLFGGPHLSWTSPLFKGLISLKTKISCSGNCLETTFPRVWRSLRGTG